LESEYEKIHIRVFQRTNRKFLTILQNIDSLISQNDEKTVIKYLKNKLCCNGHIKEHKEYGNVIQLQGDKRYDLRDILVEHYKIDPEHIEIHGY
jgi:translation initiation factor 1